MVTTGPAARIIGSRGPEDYRSLKPDDWFDIFWSAVSLLELPSLRRLQSLPGIVAREKEGIDEIEVDQSALDNLSLPRGTLSLANLLPLAETMDLPKWDEWPSIDHRKPGVMQERILLFERAKEDRSCQFHELVIYWRLVQEWDEGGMGPCHVSKRKLVTNRITMARGMSLFFLFKGLGESANSIAARALYQLYAAQATTSDDLDLRAKSALLGTLRFQGYLERLGVL